MNKTRIRNLVAALLLAVIATVATVAYAGWPVSTTLALPGGATNVVSVGYDAGIGQSAYTSFKVTAIQYSLSSATTAAGTLTLRRASGGPVWHTATIASNATVGVDFVTNDFSILRGDDIHITLSNTNAGTVIVYGEEQ